MLDELLVRNVLQSSIRDIGGCSFFSKRFLPRDFSERVITFRVCLKKAKSPKLKTQYYFGFLKGRIFGEIRLFAHFE